MNYLQQVEHAYINITLFFGVFLTLIIILYSISKRFSSIPYTISLLTAGLLTRYIFMIFGDPDAIYLEPAIIYHVLLPILLFESSFHINIHQLKIQFKTISFLATIGLLISVFVTGVALFYAIGIPFKVALLFGAIIATTDLIGVIALFKNLGGPKRLALVADGESLLSDATGVIVFKLVSTFVIADEIFNSDHLFSSVGDFFYIFIGSMIVGTLIGYITAKTVFHRLSHDKLLITTFTLAFTFIVFNAVEHYFHLSGVITLVIAAIVLGNFGKSRISNDTAHFINEFWEHFGFFCVSLVFFFATFDLNFDIFREAPLWHIAAAIAAALLGRAVSIYAGCLITNYTPFFKDEPNIPMSWQHILKWGGLRGVLPIIFVYSIPQDYIYYNELLVFTFSSILFTLIVNGFTIKHLLLWLGLHLPAEEEEIIEKEVAIFTLEESRKELKKLPVKDFTEDALKEVEDELYIEEERQREFFQLYANKPELVIKSLKIQALEIEKKIAGELLDKGYINDEAFTDFESEIDLQLDAIEYPDIFTTGGVDNKGKVKSRVSFRKLLHRFNAAFRQFPLLKKVLKNTQEDLILSRYKLLTVRLLASDDVLWYLDYVKKMFKSNAIIVKELINMEKMQHDMQKDNTAQIKELMKEYPALIKKQQKKVIYNLLRNKVTEMHY